MSRLIGFAFFLLVFMVSASHAQTSRTASAASYLERGNQWLANVEWDRAIADYDLAIAFDERSAIAYYNRGLARQHKGDLTGTLSDYDRAIRLNPRYADAYLNRGPSATGSTNTTRRSSTSPGRLSSIRAT